MNRNAVLYFLLMIGCSMSVQGVIPQSENSLNVKFSYNFPLPFDKLVQFGIGTNLKSEKWERSIGCMYAYYDYDFVHDLLTPFETKVSVNRFCITYTCSKFREQKKFVSLKMEFEFETGINNIKSSTPLYTSKNQSISLECFYGPKVRFKISKKVALEFSAKLGFGYAFDISRNTYEYYEWRGQVMTVNSFGNFIIKL